MVSGATVEKGKLATAQPAVVGALSRRHVLGLMATSAAAGVLRLRLAPAAAAGAEPVTAIRGFLTADELAILDAATARLIPTDSQAGARECHVINYIQNMLSFSLLSFLPGSDANCDHRLSAADVTGTVLRSDSPSTACPKGGDLDGNGVVDGADVAATKAAVFGAWPVYAGGPFSGRQPQPHFPTGTTPCAVCHSTSAQQGSAAIAATSTVTADNYPPNFFTQFLPLSRLRALSWKIRILGAAAVPEAAGNPLATESLEVDLRRRYRAGLAELEAISINQPEFGMPFVQLTPEQQARVLDMADASFVTLLTYHTIEGMLCAPEYGGNRDRLGWQLIGFGGDSQPQGYTIYDETTGQYRELEDKPNSRPNPNEDCSGFSTGVNNFLRVVATAELTKPGRKFSAPYCFDVST